MCSSEYVVSMKEYYYGRGKGVPWSNEFKKIDEIKFQIFLYCETRLNLYYMIHYTHTPEYATMQGFLNLLSFLSFLKDHFMGPVFYKIHFGK